MSQNGPFVLKLKYMYFLLEIVQISIYLHKNTVRFCDSCYFLPYLRCQLIKGTETTLLVLFNRRREFHVLSNLSAKEFTEHNVLLNSGPYMNGKAGKDDILSPPEASITVHSHVLMLREATAIAAKSPSHRV